MNPPSMESIFLILSGVILVAGVLYWLWSHIQLTQKKVQLLENAVFELRGMLANSGGGASGPGGERSGSSGAPASPTRQIQLNATGQVGGTGNVEVTRTEADEDDGWGDDAPAASPSNRVSTPLDALDTPVLEVADDLQPGGRAAPGVIAEEAAPAPVASEEERQSESFRRLFAVQDVTEVAPTPASSSASVASAPAPAVKTPESLESMPVKELRRLAEQRGIAGAADMRKKEILAALRQQVTSTTTVNLTLPESGAEAGEVKEVSIEREGHESSDAVVTAEILE